jgi:hypothetical protein
MKPGIDHHLMAIAATLATKLIPAIPEGDYAQGDAKMTALLAVMMAQEADRVADTLIRENAAMRAVFKRAAAFVPGELAGRLAVAAAGQEASFHISALETNNAVLKRLLIELQALVEARADGWARGLNQDVWALLHQGANDRLLMIPPA